MHRTFRSTRRSGAHAASGPAWFFAHACSFPSVARSLAALPFPPCVPSTVTVSLSTRSAVSSFSNGLQRIPLYGRTVSQCRGESLSVSSCSAYRTFLQKPHVPGLMECSAFDSSWAYEDNTSLRADCVGLPTKFIRDFPNLNEVSGQPNIAVIVVQSLSPVPVL